MECECFQQPTQSLLLTAALLDTIDHRAVGVVSSLGPLPALLTIIAAMFFGWKLKDVHDFSNMGRDIRLVGATMVASFREQPSS